MKKQDYLVQFIATLTPNEKRHFKLFSDSQPGNKRYLRLFKALENQQTYDAKALAKQLRLTTKQLTDDKYYLQQVLTKSLRLYKEESNENYQLIALMQQADEVISRGLYDFALQILDKAIEQANNLEAVDLLPRLLTMQLDCFYNTSQYDKVATIKKDIDRANKAVEEYVEIKTYAGQLTKFQQSHLDGKHFVNGNNALLKKNPAQLLTSRAKVWFYHMLQVYYFAVAVNYEKLLVVLSECIEYFELNPGVIKQNYLHYVNQFNKLSAAQYELKQYDQSWQSNEKCIALLEKAPDNVSKVYRARLLLHSKLKRIEYFAVTGKNEEGLKAAQELYRQRNEMPPYEQFFISFMLIMFLMHTRQSAKAADCINELLKLHGDLLSDIQLYVRVVAVLIQFDLDNYRVIPHNIRATKSWLKRHKITHPEMDLFLSLTYSIANAPVLKRSAQWAKLKQALNNNQLPELNKAVDIASWLNQKLARP